MALIPKPRVARPDNLPVPAAPPVMRALAELEPERGYLSREMAEIAVVDELTGEEDVLVQQNGKARKSPLRYIVSLAREQNTPPARMGGGGGGGRHTYERSVIRSPLKLPEATDTMLAVRDGATVRFTLESIGTFAGDMLKSVYDADDDGVIDNSEQLDGQLPAYYLARANHTGTQTAATISDFSEAVDDRTAALIQNGTGITWSYNDGAGTLTATVSLASFSTTNLSEGANLYYTDERVDDRVAALLQNGTGISWSYNDASGTLTPTVSLAAFSTSNLSEGSNLYYTDERVDDRVAVLIQNGTGITWSYNDASGTLTPTISLASFSTTNLSEGSNLYFTDERAQDAIGTALTDSATIDFTYTDASNQITAIVIDDSISNAKLANVATQTFKGRTTAGTGDPEDLTVAQAKTLLSLTGTNSGDQTITLTGDVTGSGTGSFAATIAAGAVTLAKMANMATASLIYRRTAGSGAPEVNTLAQLKTDLTLVKGDVGLGNVDNTSDATKNAAVAALTNKDLTSGTNTFPTLNQNTTGSAAKLTTARNIDGQAFDGTAAITVIAPGTHAATTKATPVDADELPLVDSAASNVLKKLTWANLKATLKTYFDTLYYIVGGTDVAVADGGTGASTASGARTNLGLGTAATKNSTSGTFTPVLKFGGAAVGLTYTTQAGSHTQIDDRVSGEIQIVVNAKGSSTGTITIEGLPVAPTANGAAVFFGITVTATGTIMCLISNGSTSLTLWALNGGGATQLTDTAIAAGSNIVISFQYRA